MIALLVAAGVVIVLLALLVLRRRQAGAVGRHLMGGEYLRAPIGQLRADLGEAINPALPAARRAGLRLMAGRTEKNLRFLSRTLVWRSEPETARRLVADPIVATRLFTPTGPEGPEHAAWSGNSTFGPRLRLVLQASSVLPGHVELGIHRFDWYRRFPQGGLFMNRVVTRVRPVLADAGLSAEERQVTFAPIPGRGGPYSGTWQRIEP